MLPPWLSATARTQGRPMPQRWAGALPTAYRATVLDNMRASQPMPVSA